MFRCLIPVGRLLRRPAGGFLSDSSGLEIVHKEPAGRQRICTPQPPDGKT
jgi:hypothetical protein